MPRRRQSTATLANKETLSAWVTAPRSFGFPGPLGVDAPPERVIEYELWKHVTDGESDRGAHQIVAQPVLVMGAVSHVGAATKRHEPHGYLLLSWFSCSL